MVSGTVDRSPSDFARPAPHGGGVERDRHRLRAWDETAWPVLAGTVVAVGVWSACVTLGAVFVLALFVVLDLAITPLVQGLGAAVGTQKRRAVLVVAPRWALATIVCLGLAGAFRGWPMLLIIACVLAVTLTARSTRRVLAGALDSTRSAARRATPSPAVTRSPGFRDGSAVSLELARSGLRCRPFVGTPASPCQTDRAVSWCRDSGLRMVTSANRAGSCGRTVIPRASGHRSGTAR
jgi:hypothetical protein